mmetsp:Transcript_1079/g.1723  ORF Transcript_1079/g.1723 Transcript_1079/m.1723 type:complete len:268 (-) Transcript_1079:131-934(-)
MVDSLFVLLENLVHSTNLSSGLSATRNLFSIRLAHVIWQVSFRIRRLFVLFLQQRMVLNGSTLPVLRLLSLCFAKKICSGTSLQDILELKKFRPKDLILRRLGEDIKTVDHACKEIKESLEMGVMVFATSYNPDFPTFDAIIGWQVKTKIYFRGLQMKLTRGLPKKDAPSRIPGILLRGDPPEKGSPTRRKNWTYVTSSELKSFVPYSMQHLIPATWEQEDEKIEDEKEKKEEKKRKRERGDRPQEKERKKRREDKKKVGRGRGNFN